jgi:hypothetical protein
MLSGGAHIERTNSARAALVDNYPSAVDTWTVSPSRATAPPPAPSRSPRGFSAPSWRARGPG